MVECTMPNCSVGCSDGQLAAVKVATGPIAILGCLIHNLCKTSELSGQSVMNEQCHEYKFVLFRSQDLSF